MSSQKKNLQSISFVIQHILLSWHLKWARSSCFGFMNLFVTTSTFDPCLGRMTCCPIFNVYPARACQCHKSCHWDTPRLKTPQLALKSGTNVMRSEGCSHTLPPNQQDLVQLLLHWAGHLWSWEGMLIPDYYNLLVLSHSLSWTYGLGVWNNRIINTLSWSRLLLFKAKIHLT